MRVGADGASQPTAIGPSSARATDNNPANATGSMHEVLLRNFSLQKRQPSEAPKGAYGTRYR